MYNDDPVAQNIVLGKKKKEKESSKVLHEKLMVDLNVKPKVDGVEEDIDDGFDLDWSEKKSSKQGVSGAGLRPMSTK